MKRTVALYGGSFDPIHRGHVEVIEAVLKSGRAEEVWVAPVFTHPFGIKRLVPFDERVKMCELALARFGSRVRIIRNEEENGDGTTFNLLFHLSVRYPDIEFLPVIGETEALEIEDWHRGKELTEQYRFIVIPRHLKLASHEVWYKKEPHTYMFHVVTTNISSTKIKEQLAGLRELLAPQVLARIASLGLYLG